MLAALLPPPPPPRRRCSARIYMLPTLIISARRTTEWPTGQRLSIRASVRPSVRQSVRPFNAVRIDFTIIIAASNHWTAARCGALPDKPASHCVRVFCTFVFSFGLEKGKERLRLTSLRGLLSRRARKQGTGTERT